MHVCMHGYQHKEYNYNYHKHFQYPGKQYTVTLYYKKHNNVKESRKTTHVS